MVYQIAYKSTDTTYVDNDKERAINLYHLYAADSLNYLAFSENRLFFFSAQTKGFLPYIILKKKAISIGDPVCESGTLAIFIDEYLNFCKSRSLKAVFCSVSCDMTDILNMYGFNISKYGTEAILDLESYTLVGSKKAKLRQKINKVEKIGVNIVEYTPYKRRDYNLEAKIDEMSKQWFLSKKCQFNFSVGDLDFDNPTNKRYFVSVDSDGNVMAVLSFLSYLANKAYLLDVMRRNLDGESGIMEYSIIKAAMMLKEDGVEKISLGIAPLADIEFKKNLSTKFEKYANHIYNNVDLGYDFKSLYEFKKKFEPTEWKPRFIAYDSRIKIFDLGLVILKTKTNKTNNTNKPLGIKYLYKLLIGYWEANRKK